MEVARLPSPAMPAALQAAAQATARHLPSSAPGGTATLAHVPRAPQPGLAGAGAAAAALLVASRSLRASLRRHRAPDLGHLRAAATAAAASRPARQGQQEKGPEPSNTGSFARGAVVGIVVAAVVGGISTLTGLPWRYAGIAFAVQWGFFLLHGWPRRSESLYDASGSLTHLLLIIAALTADSLRHPRQLVAGVLAVVWCARLGTFLFSRITRDGEDTRFRELKKDFWSFSIAWNLQVMWVFLLELPILVTNAELSQPPVGALDVVGWGLWAVGFLVQSLADAQKLGFRTDPANKGRFITSGLWRYSRHPNYFGEILMWVGICVSCSSGFVGWQWLAWLSPAFDALLLLRVSGVPMLEKAGEKKWGSEAGYQHYMQNTSCIVPWFPAPPFPAPAEPGKEA